MLDLLRTFPEQCEEAVEIGKGFEVRRKKIDKILICGMGGSGISGYILKDLLNTIPVHVIQDYYIPNFVDSNTLVFAVSYSGNTEETISAFKQAKRKNAYIIGITSGGMLEKICNSIIIPKGLPPRMALGYLFFPMLITLEKMGIAKMSKEAGKTITILKKNRKKFEIEGKKLAKIIGNRLPIIYSPTHLSSVVMRWKAEFNENSKTFAHYNLFPELNHNEVVGFESLHNPIFIFIRDKEYKRIEKRVEITKRLIKFPKHDFFVSGSHMAKIFSAIYVGDFASYYLAKNKGIDPFPIKNINFLKKELGKSK